MDGVSQVRQRRPRYPVGDDVAAFTTGQRIYDGVILFLLAGSALVGPWLYGGSKWWSIGLLTGAVYTAAALYAARSLLFSGARSPLFPASVLAGGAYVAYLAFRIPFSVVPYEALLETLRIGGLLLSFWLWVNLSGRRHWWKWLLGALMLSAVLMSLYALIQYNKGSRMVLFIERPSDYGMRASGAFLCPNHFASFIGMMIPLSIALLVTRDAGYPMRIVAGYALVVLSPALVLTGSRSGLLGVLFGSVIAIILRGARRGSRALLLSTFLAPLAALLVAGGLWLGSDQIRQRVNDAMEGNIRIPLWQDTLDMIGTAPLMGHGAGSFRWLYPEYWKHLTAYTDPENAHNEFLQGLAENGAVGTLLLVLAAGLAGWALLSRLRSTRREKTGALIVGAAGAGATVLLHAAFDYNLHLAGVAGAFVMILGIATSQLVRSDEMAQTARIPPRVRNILCAGLSLLCLFAAFRTAMATGSELCNLHGDAALLIRNVPEEALVSYGHAAAMDPWNWRPDQGRADALRARSAWYLDPELKAQESAEAAACYDRTLSRNPKNLTALVGLALLRANMGDNEKALELFRQAVAKAPYHADNTALLAQQLKDMGRPAEALEAFRKARTLGADTEFVRENIRLLESSATRPAAP